MLDTSVVEWPLMLPPLTLSYNVGVNKATKCTPFFLLYGVHPKTPYFDGTLKDKVNYGENYAAEVHHRLMLARAVAKEHNIEYRQQYEDYHNTSKVAKKFVEFQENDIVWLHRPELQKKHLKKITLPWEGPYAIVKLTPQNALIQHCATQKTRFVHRDRLRKVMNRQISYPKDTPLEKQNEVQGEQQQQQQYSEPEVVILNPEDPAPLPKPLVKTEEDAASSAPAPAPAPAPEPGPAPAPAPAIDPTPFRIKEEPEEDLIVVDQSPPPAEKPAVEVDTPMADPRTKAPILSRAKGTLLEHLPKSKVKKMQAPFQGSQFQTSRLTRQQAQQQDIRVEDLPLPKKLIERKTKKK